MPHEAEQRQRGRRHRAAAQVVVGETWSLLWDSNGNVQDIQDGGTAYAVNAGGLITGERSDIVGRASVWRDTAFQSELPYPDGVTGVFELFVVGNDDSLFSHAYSHGPLRWTCA
ncbi:hypothetical protein [Lentzea atacamensis]|uniref:hypothetical protein n=1 Tax=Lentzea atacamensis TaxID=531938 RepID=UPI001C02F96A|nr:hypothetical protein [Lentzea atacamensis]